MTFLVPDKYALWNFSTHSIENMKKILKQTGTNQRGKVRFSDNAQSCSRFTGKTLKVISYITFIW